MLNSPRNGASTLLNTTAEAPTAAAGDDAAAEQELLGAEVTAAGSRSSLRKGLLLGALLLAVAVAAALLLVATPWGEQQQLHQPHGSNGLQPALRSERQFGFLQLRSEEDGDEEKDGDDKDDKEEADDDAEDDKEEDDDDKEDDDDPDSADQEDGEDGDDTEEGDEADGDGDDEETETTTSTRTTTTMGISGQEEAHDPNLAHIDKDGDGKISDDEWHGFVDNVRNSLSDIPDEVDKHLKDYYDGGELNYHELDVLLWHLWYHSVEKGFKTYDKNNDGLLEKKEIRPYAKELEQDFGLSSQDFNDIFDAADDHEDKVLCAKEQDVTEEWTWDACTCLTPNDSKLSLCEVPGLLHAINLHFKKLEEKS